MSSDPLLKLYDMGLPIFSYIRRLLDCRKQHLSLSRGRQIVRHSNAAGPGIFAWSRIFGSVEAIVVINTANSTQIADIILDESAIDIEWQDVFDTSYVMRSRSSNPMYERLRAPSLRVKIPRRGMKGVRVLFPRLYLDNQR
jgi:hypothetical protein